MEDSRFKSGVAIFNKKINLSELRIVNPRSLVVLYSAQILMFFGILLILFNNFDKISPGSYLGTFNWLTITIFFIGILLNFLFIPLLYFSSFDNFKKESDFWDKETFWILPLSFFGFFFLFSSKIFMMMSFIVISTVVIMFVHVKFLLESRRIFIRNSKRSIADQGQYFVTLNYLTVYYLLLAFLFIFRANLSSVFA